MARKHRKWVKLWSHWYTRLEHLGLSADALALGPAIMVLSDASWDMETGTAKVPSVDAICRLTRGDVMETETAMEELISAGTLEREADGSIIWPEYGEEQETAQAARTRKYREDRVTVTQQNENSDGDCDAESHAPVTTEGRGKMEMEMEKKEEDSAPRKRVAPSPPSAEAIEIAQFLYDAILTHRPDFKANEKKLTGWAKHIDVGMRRDSMTVGGCKEAVDAAHRSAKDFWRPNVLSGKKLRKHYEALRTTWASENKANTDPTVWRPGEVDYEAYGAVFEAAENGVKT